ncbi:MAG: hypothetical protein CVV47_10440 [Spirochaetae bacterium HGW-Spirochaetae-3]|nr:MAG: hypothetical protein CVV47_10440 [Spirochaetae bacterium HGW-Spirochaetae-3]
MNLLAHVLIAYATLPDTDGQECTGALMADYFPGRDLASYPRGIRDGLLQHRAVDAFTDAHPAFVSCRRAIAAAGAPRFTAGILADIFWDHVLASEWHVWGRPLCGLGLDPFCREVYGRLSRAEAYHSPGFASVFRFLSNGSWLSSYARLDGIEKTLAGLSERMSGRPDLAACIGILVDLDREIRGDFAEFWPRLLDYARDWARTSAE